MPAVSSRLAPRLKRVEVLRGSRSALYGSDAIGGVIQIFTRRGNGPGLQPRLRLAAGSNQTFQRSLGLSGGNGSTRFNLGASLDETAGIDSTGPSFASDNDHDATATVVQPEPEPYVWRAVRGGGECA